MSPPRPAVDLAAALPRRPVVVQPPATFSLLGVAGLFALLLGLMAAIVSWLGPDLVRDWRLQGDAEPAGDVRVQQVRCRSWLALVSFCEVAIDQAVSGKRTFSYLLVGKLGGEAAVAVRSRVEPANVSTSLGLEQVWSRGAALAILVAAVAFCFGVGLQSVRRGWSLQRAFASMSGQRLAPVVVEIERKNAVPPRRRMWVYLYDDGEGRGRAVVELPWRNRLLFVTPDERYALAVRADQGGPPMLLDATLASLDLTDAEKSAFYEVCRAAFAGERAG